MEKIEVYVEKIIFRNEENFYTVLSASSTESGEEYTVVGRLPFIEAGEHILASGEFSVHDIYGEQFNLESYESIAPENKDAVQKYLASGAIKGIGKALAKRIVKKFGEDTMEIIENEPERLSEVKGISDRKAMDIADSFSSKRYMQSAIMYMQKYGINLAMAGKIYAFYGEKLYEIIRENPYKLAEDIEGLGFKSCDLIARSAGIAKDSDYRIDSGIIYTLSLSEQNGNTYMNIESLESELINILGLNHVNLNDHLLKLQLEGKLMVKGDKVYRAISYYTELNIAVRLEELNVARRNITDNIDELIKRHAISEGIELDKLQKEAVEIALSSGLLLITGGPGTGKTTTINTIINIFREHGDEVLLAAPTGRAAKRMSQSSGYEAKTIHRLLEYQGVPDEESNDLGIKGHFERNEKNPLEADVIIIDEMSMVDIYLMNSLLKAIAGGTRLVLVGDADQLPSVGAGNVLGDIIKSGKIRTVRLERIFRQAAKSDIIINAHKINKGEDLDLSKISDDFLFIRSLDPEKIAESIYLLLSEKLPDYLDVDPMAIQVMSPQRKGKLGVENLNRFLQMKLNPASKGKAEKKFADNIFRTGDKVMQIRNDYTLSWEIRGLMGMPIERGEGVFNGDIGVITEINSYAKNLTVLFDDERYVEYEFKNCDSLELAYAITVHKSQGSEYPAVIIPLYQGPSMLMTRNILYTAVTRARKCVCLIGDPRIFQKMLHNKIELDRRTSLDERIEEIENLGNEAEFFEDFEIGDDLDPFKDM